MTRRTLPVFLSTVSLISPAVTAIVTLLWTTFQFAIFDRTALFRRAVRSWPSPNERHSTPIQRLMESDSAGSARNPPNLPAWKRATPHGSRLPDGGRINTSSEEVSVREASEGADGLLDEDFRNASPGSIVSA